MTQQELKQGESFFFHNEQWCIDNKSDDLRQAEVLFKDNTGHTWADGFVIWFNGAIIHHCKTFKSLEKRLNKLCLKWNLTEGEEL